MGLRDDSGIKFLDKLDAIASEDSAGLKKAQESYGNSWKVRGGVGAFMMLSRKWDRLEIRVKKLGWNIFEAIISDQRSEGIIDDVVDLRRYLMLVEAEMRARGFKSNHRDNTENKPITLSPEKEKIIKEYHRTRGQMLGDQKPRQIENEENTPPTINEVIEKGGRTADRVIKEDKNKCSNCSRYNNFINRDPTCQVVPSRSVPRSNCTDFNRKLG